VVPACDAAIASQKTPTTGTVTGDTWLDFRRAYGRSATIWFVVDEFGGEDPIQGSVYQNGIPETVSGFFFALLRLCALHVA
jgi:hypothetical protein